MNNFIDRVLMHPVLDWLARASVAVFSVAMLIAVFAAFWWGVA